MKDVYRNLDSLDWLVAYCYCQYNHDCNFFDKAIRQFKILRKNFRRFKKSVIKSVSDYKESIANEFDKFKTDLNEKIKENQEHTKEHIVRLEQKQDKHNNLIERMVRVEDSSKSAHKRLDDIEDFQHDCIFRKGAKPQRC